ncbi:MULTISPECIES: EthD family reductase [unclassified Streptomyces]|uniref:EthD family reductase n=1 Tax=unclassified Streptomyces TaxID=2593676 RepID=UPI003D8AD30B
MTVRLLALYETPTDPERFDRHYREVHIPLGRRLPGLRRYPVSRDVAAVRGGAPYYLVAELEWDTMDDLRAAFASRDSVLSERNRVIREVVRACPRVADTSLRLCRG